MLGAECRNTCTTPARRGVLLTTLLAALLLNEVGVQTDFNAASVAGPAAYCFGWELLNSTGHDADGLLVPLQDVHHVTTAHQVADNAFGQPPPTSGYGVQLDASGLEFGGGAALDRITTHIEERDVIDQVAAKNRQENCFVPFGNTRSLLYTAVRLPVQ